MNLLFKAGSKHDPEDRTGLAHLLEHMMFTGSKHIEDFDQPLQLASGENNAFTNKDITNYYDTVPLENLSTALWLESDRMKDLVFDEASYITQKKVVIEEYKETCLNEPYGMIWHHLMALAYKTHPYRWPTIGLNESHIQSIELNDLEAYYKRYYAPNNAVLCIGGSLTDERAFAFAEEWFGDLQPYENGKGGHYLTEPEQLAFRHGTMTVDAPVEMIYLAFHMPDRLHENFHASDYITDILGGGKSSRLYQRLVKEKELFLGIDSYITGNTDPGLLIVEGRLAKGTTHEQAQAEIWKILEEVKREPIQKKELTKLFNQMAASVAFGNISLLNNVINLGYYEYIGDPNLVNIESDIYAKVKPSDIQRMAQKLLVRENCCQLDIISKKGAN